MKNRITTLILGPLASLIPNPLDSVVDNSASNSLGHTSVHKRSSARELSLSRSHPIKE